MDSQRIAEIRAMLEAAHGAPWQHCAASEGRCTCGLIWGASGDDMIAQAISESNYCAGEGYSHTAMLDNMRLIAAAPTIISELLAEVERLQAEVEDMRSHISYLESFAG